MENKGLKSRLAPFYARHLFGALVVFAILIASSLVFVSMALYYSSGASQLDLSSPSYVDIRDQIDKSDDFEQYSSTGKMDLTAISGFKSLFNQKVEKIKTVNAFGSDPLDPTSLGMSETVTTEAVVTE